MTATTLFWIFAIALVIAVAYFGFRGYFSPDAFLSNDPKAGQESTRQLLQEQLRELKADLAAGRTTQALYDESVAEIESNALELLDDNSKSKGDIRSEKPANRWIFVSLMTVACLLSLGLYNYLGSPKLIPFVDAQISGQGLYLPDGTLAQRDRTWDEQTMVKYLEVFPEDERAWILLAMFYEEEKAWQKAADAYAKGVRLNGLVSKDKDVLLHWASSLLSIRSRQAYESVFEPLRLVFALDDTDPIAMEFYAIACLETERWQEAVIYLERVLTNMHPSDPATMRVQEALRYAQRQWDKTHK